MNSTTLIPGTNDILPNYQNTQHLEKEEIFSKNPPIFENRKNQKSNHDIPNLTDDLPCFEKIRELNNKNPNNITCSYLNINSIRNKFNNLSDMIDQNIDIICIAETKIDSSFPKSNFLMPGYITPYRLDVNERSGGLLVYIKDHIISKQLTNFLIPKDIQIIPFEINLRKNKWLLISTYRPPTTSESYFIDNLNSLIDFYSREYDNILILGDLNMEISNRFLAPLLESHDLKSLNKKPTCYKSKQGKCIDHILTNRSRSFKFTNTFETGMSDHHLMIYTMFKMTFEKSGPKIIYYRSYRNFNKDLFERDLFCQLQNVTAYEIFEEIFTRILDSHAPLKQKLLRANNKPFVNKELKKAISTRSRLRNIANRTGKKDDLNKYKHQRNYVTFLNRKTQKEYYKNLNPKNIQTTKSFFDIFKPFFSSKYTHFEKMILVENGEIISDDISCAELMNHYLVNITDSLNITEWPTSSEIESIDDEVNRAILKYANHPSIKKIQANFEINSRFKFRNVTPDEIYNEIKKLDPSKSTSGNIPVKIIKEYLFLYLNPLTHCFNNCINENKFPDPFKLADVTPIFKKDNKTQKENYRGISILKALAKVLERLLSKQLIEFMTPNFSPFLCGFRKGHNTQHALLRLLEDWRAKLENKEIIGTILCDLSKAFDTLPHDLLIAKLNAYGVEYNSLKLISNYLTNRKQRCKIGSSFSTWADILVGVPQGSVLGPLFFNICINDFFFSIKESSICNFADHQNIYTSAKHLIDVVYKLENDMKNALAWFNSNRMVANPNKFQIMFLGTNRKIDLCLDINGNTCRSSTVVKLLGTNIDWKLKFNHHVKEICKIANNKTKALVRLRFKLNQSQKLTLYHSYVMSYYSYCPLIWMFCGINSNELINRVQRKALRAVYNDYTSDFNQLLDKGNHLTIHQINLRSLLTEVYKCLNNENPSFLSYIFEYKSVRYNLRISNLLIVPQIRTITYGLNSFSYRGSMTWNNLADNIKNSENLEIFKSEMKLQKVIKCTCHLCQ